MMVKDISTLGLNKSTLEGLYAISGVSKQFRIVKEYGLLEDAMNGILYDSCDLLIVEMPEDEYGLSDFFKYLRLSVFTTRLMVISHSREAGILRKCVENGASGLLHISNVPLLIFRAMEKVLADEVFVCSTCLKALVDDLRLDVESGLISSREKQVLEFISFGYSYQQISDALHISYDTTKSHVYNIYRKLNARNKSEAVLNARRQRLIE